jgi:hypothetical protein
VLVVLDHPEVRVPVARLLLQLRLPSLLCLLRIAQRKPPLLPLPSPASLSSVE